MQITIETTMNAKRETVWHIWTTPEHIKQWNAASDDWHTIRSSDDLRVGGKFLARMESKDGSMGFDFDGEYTRIDHTNPIEFTFGDRILRVEFNETPEGTQVREIFEADTEHPVDAQKAGWQSILDTFQRHVEAAT